MTLNEELITLRKQVKDQDKEICRLKEENEFLDDYSYAAEPPVRKLESHQSGD